MSQSFQVTVPPNVEDIEEDDVMHWPFDNDDGHGSWASSRPPSTDTAQINGCARMPARLDAAPLLQPLAPAVQLTSWKIRTPEEVQQERDRLMAGLDFGGMPMGPYPSELEIVAAIKKWAANTSIDGGGFALAAKNKQLVPASKQRGERRLLLCDRSGVYNPRGQNIRETQVSKKCSCPWAVWIENCTDGWCVTVMPKETIRALQINQSFFVQLIHNHSLLATVAETNTNAKLRGLTAEQMHVVAVLQRACNPPAQIYLTLSRDCHAQGIPVTFTVKDIANTVGKNAVEKALDCCDLVDYLDERRQRDPNLEYSFKLDSSGVLDRVFFVLPLAQERWAKMSAAVLLYDTKHGTNRYDMKVGCLTSIDERAKTQVLAVSILRYQDEDSFAWVFQKFEQSLTAAPVVCFTDSDDAMAAAIKTAWPSCRHLLCTFHLFKNFYENIHPLFVQRPAQWKMLAKRWWVLCKNSDKISCDRFALDWEMFATDIVAQANASPELIAKKLLWLSRMGVKSRQWAACYTWHSKTYGIHSTARAESIHSVIKAFCSKFSSILQLVLDLERMAEHQLQKSETEALRRQFSIVTGARPPSLFPPAAALADRLTDFAASCVWSQAAQIPLYRLLENELLPHEKKIALGFGPAEAVWCVEIRDDVFVAELFGDGEREKRRALDHGLLEPMTHKHWASSMSCTCQYQQCMGLPCRHQLYIMMHQNFVGSIPCDPFWLRDMPPPQHRRSIGKILNDYSNDDNSCSLSTKESRQKMLLATFGRIADVACESAGATEALLKVLSEHGVFLGIDGKSRINQRMEPLSVLAQAATSTTAVRKPPMTTQAPTTMRAAMSTTARAASATASAAAVPATVATAQAAPPIILTAENDFTDGDDNEYNISLSQLVTSRRVPICNPPVKAREQNRHRKEPKSCAPTSKSYKRAGRQRQRTVKGAEFQQSLVKK